MCMLKMTRGDFNGYQINFVKKKEKNNEIILINCFDRFNVRIVVKQRKEILILIKCH